MAVAEWSLWDQLMERGPSVSIGNDSVKTNLMKIWGLESQHLMDSLAVDLVCGINQLLRRAICTAKGLLDELLAVLVEQVECVQMRAG